MNIPSEKLIEQYAQSIKLYHIVPYTPSDQSHSVSLNAIDLPNRKKKEKKRKKKDDLSKSVKIKDKRSFTG